MQTAFDGKGLNFVSSKKLFKPSGTFYANFMQIPKSAEFPGNDGGSKNEESSAKNGCNNQLEPK
jgi:hypothetical protein